MKPLRGGNPSRHVAGYLATNEHIVLEVRQHWARILPPALVCIVGLLLTTAAGLMAPAWMGILTTAAWWIWLVLLGVFLWRVKEWIDETFVLTNRRLILVHGIFVKKVAMMPLSKITDMSYNRSIPARILGYGTFVMESAGQEQALDVINFVRDPDARYRELCALIFNTKDDDEPQDEPDEEVDDGTGPRGGRDRFSDSWDGWEGSPRAFANRRTRQDDDTDPHGIRVPPAAKARRSGAQSAVSDRPRRRNVTISSQKPFRGPVSVPRDLHHTYIDDHSNQASPKRGAWGEQAGAEAPSGEDGPSWAVSHEHATGRQDARADHDVDDF